MFNRTIEALIITYTIFGGVPYCTYSIIYPPNPILNFKTPTLQHLGRYWVVYMVVVSTARCDVWCSDVPLCAYRVVEEKKPQYRLSKQQESGSG